MRSTRRAIAFAATTAATVAVMTAAVTAASGTAHGATVSRCQSTHLSLHLGPAKAAAGTTSYHLRFTNEGAAPCSMYGYPGASARTSPAGPRIGHAAVRDPADPATLIILAPGGTAHAVLGTGTASDYPASRCHPVEAGAIGVYPPGAYRRLAARLGFEACAGRKVHLLSVTPIAAGG